MFLYMFKHNWAWIKLATDNFSTVLTRNLRNPRDYAPLSVANQEKATEQYFPLVLFIMLHKVVLTFESVDEILKCDHSNESY